MIDKLNAILQPSDFDLNIRIRSLSTNDLPYAKLSRQVETWLSELDVNDAVQRAVTTGGMDFEKLNSFRYKCDGWDMKFIAKSKKLVGEGERAGPSLRIIYPVFTSPISDSIRKKIKGKASRYGELSLPYIIALNVDFPFSVYNVEEVFGVTLNSETGKFIQDHNPNGIWGGPKTYQHKRVSGVSLFRSLRPETMLAEPVLWHHPKANNPLPPDLWPFDQQIFNIEQGYYELREGRQSAVESLGIDVKRMPK